MAEQAGNSPGSSGFSHEYEPPESDASPVAASTRLPGQRASGHRDDVPVERLGLAVTQRLPVGDTAPIGLAFRRRDGLDPFGLGASVVLADDLLGDLLTLVGEAVLVERAHGVGHPDLPVVVETLYLAVLVDEAGLLGAFRDYPVDLAGHRFERVDELPARERGTEQPKEEESGTARATEDDSEPASMLSRFFSDR